VSENVESLPVFMASWREFKSLLSVSGEDMVGFGGWVGVEALYD